jgi:hypothetical protein
MGRKGIGWYGSSGQHQGIRIEQFPSAGRGEEERRGEERRGEKRWNFLLPST